MKYIIPAVMALTLVFGCFKKQPVYSLFCEGAMDGAKIVLKIFAPLLAILCASSMLRASGAIDILCGALSPVLNFFHIPEGVWPLIMLRPVSGSGSLGILSDIIKTYGADSLEGNLASVICASTETTFYCIMVYFADTRVKHSLKAVLCAVIGDVTGILTAAAVMRFM